MSDPQDDPNVTAYILGELSKDEADASNKGCEMISTRREVVAEGKA